MGQESGVNKNRIEMSVSSCSCFALFINRVSSKLNYFNILRAACIRATVAFHFSYTHTRMYMCVCVCVRYFSLERNVVQLRN